MKGLYHFIVAIDGMAEQMNNWFCHTFEWFFTNGIKAQYVKDWYEQSET